MSYVQVEIPSLYILNERSGQNVKKILVIFSFFFHFFSFACFPEPTNSSAWLTRRTSLRLVIPDLTFFHPSCRSVFIPAVMTSLCCEQDQFSPIVGVDSNSKSGSFCAEVER